MPPIDPALGLSGALTALQTQPPLTAAPNAQPLMPADNSSANLANAAKSLESVRGDVSGQTMAIQQMAMTSQQQSVNLQMLITQLGNQVTGLMSAINNLSMSMSMSGVAPMTSPVAAPPMGAMGPPPMDFGDGGGGFGSRFAGMALGAGAMALRGGALAGRGLAAAGGMIGGTAAAATLPFFGTPVAPPAPGAIASGLGQDVGIYRGGLMATGLGITPSMMRTAGAAHLQELGQERMQNRIGGAFTGLVGGAASVGNMFLGDAAGSAIAGGLGWGGYGSMASGNAVTRFGGMMGGGLLGGMLLGVPAQMAIDETMGQTAAIRGFGNQFARNAFRFMPTQGVGYGQLRRPGTQQRLRAGQAMERMAIDDLTFNEEDVREMFAGVTQQDLMRGVSSVDQVVERFRNTKETFKLIGRRMGQGLQEAAGTMGTLQELGFDPTSQRGRAAIFGASSMLGLTPTEGMQRAVGVVGQTGAVAGGYGREMLGAAQMGIGAAQSAIQTGQLGAVGTAALGGREGAQQALPMMLNQFMSTGMGQAMLMAGPEAIGGMGINQIFGAAAQRGNQNRGRMMQMAMGGMEMKQEFMRDPHRALAQVLPALMEQADILRQNDETIPKDLALMQVMVTTGLAANDAQARGLLDIIKGMPQYMRDQQMAGAREVSGQLSSQTMENVSRYSKLKRHLKRVVNEAAAEPLTEAAAGIEAAAGRAMTSVYRAYTGTEVIDVGGQMNLGTLREMRQRGGGAAAGYEQEYVPGQTEYMGRSNVFGDIDPANYNAGVRARNKIREEQAQIDKATAHKGTIDQMRRTAQNVPFWKKKKIDELKTLVNDPDTPMGTKNRAISELMDVVSDGAYSRAKITGQNLTEGARKRNLGIRKAIEEVVRNEHGVDAGSQRTGGGFAAGEVSEKDRELLEARRGDLAKGLKLEKPEMAAGFERKELVDYLNALAGKGDMDLAEAKQNIEDAGLTSQMEALNKYVEREAGWGTSHEEAAASIAESLKAQTAAGDKVRTSDVLRERVGSPMARAISELRRREYKDKGRASENLRSIQTGILKRGGVGTIDEVNKIIKNLTPEQVQAMKESKDADVQRQASILQTLQGFMRGDNRLNEDEAKTLAKMTGRNYESAEFKKEVAEVNRTGELGSLAVDALAGNVPAGTMVTRRRGQALSPEQNAQLNQWMTQSIEMGKYLKDIGTIVQQLQEKAG